MRKTNPEIELTKSLKKTFKIYGIICLILFVLMIFWTEFVWMFVTAGILMIIHTGIMVFAHIFKYKPSEREKWERVSERRIKKDNKLKLKFGWWKLPIYLIVLFIVMIGLFGMFDSIGDPSIAFLVLLLFVSYIVFGLWRVLKAVKEYGRGSKEAEDEIDTYFFWWLS